MKSMTYCNSPQQQKFPFASLENKGERKPIGSIFLLFHLISSIICTVYIMNVYIYLSHLMLCVHLIAP